MSTVQRLVVPQEAEEAFEALSRAKQDDGPVALQAGGVRVSIPGAAVDLLVEILDQLAHGHAVQVLPVHSDLTTQQAANLLNISRPHLVKLLEEGAIPFHRVGSHRRVRMGDALVYKQKRDALRARDLDELAAEAQVIRYGG